VDRHVVSRGIGVTVCLVLIEGIRNSLQRLGVSQPVGESVIGCLLTGALPLGRTAEGQREILLVEQYADVISRLKLQDNGRTRSLYVNADRQTTYTDDA